MNTIADTVECPTCIVDTVECPTCGAAQYDTCTTPAGGHAKALHAARITAAREVEHARADDAAAWFDAAWNQDTDALND